MNPLLRKELRLIMPAWIASLVAALLPLWLGWQLEGLIPVAFGIAVLGLVLSPFGLEASHGTFGLLLVQPADRRRFWRIKTSLLALALASVCGVFIVVGLEHVHQLDSADISTAIKWSLLVPLLAFSGGLWTTLLLRDVISSFFCTLLAPLAISTLISLVLGHWLDDQGPATDPKILQNVVFWALLAYAVAGFLWARWLFLRAQDVAWSGGKISLTTGRGISLRWLAFEFKGRQNPWTALIKKEMQSQEITMLLIPVFLVFHVILIVASHFAGDHRLPKELTYNVFPFIWLVAVPLVIGCVSIADERRLNTMESMLCLPMTKRAQFGIKFSVAMILGTILGGLAPWLLLRMGGHMGKDFKAQPAMEIAAAITAIAFYGSSMSRSLLQALPTAVCVPMVVSGTGYFIGKFMLFRGDPYGNSSPVWMQSSVFLTVVLPTMALTLIWLSYSNFKRLQIGWKVWVGDFIRAGITFSCAVLVVIAIFDRFWQLFEPLEPSHGPTRISGAGRAAMGATYRNVFIVLPDSRLWVGNAIYVGKKHEQRLKRVTGSFASVSNWVQLVANNLGAAGIQSDGTLWKISNKSEISQLGSDTDWKTVAANSGTFMAVKQNGTLWGWGYDNAELLTDITNHPKNYPPLAAPIRIGTNSDWDNIFLSGGGNRALGVARDGTAWTWGNVFRNERSEELPVGKRIFVVSNFGDFHSVIFTWNDYAAIRDDGTLWVMGKQLSPVIFGQPVKTNQNNEPVRLGTKSDWVSLTGNWELAALESNGTLSAGEFYYGGSSKQPSKYHDWIAASSYGGTWALAKDGTLSHWEEFNIDMPDTADFSKRFFLGPTRKPVVTLNIFSQ